MITDRISYAAGFSIFLNIINTARCVNTVRMPVNYVRALPQNQQTWHTHTHTHNHHDRSDAVAILANGTYFLDNPLYGNVMLAHSSILTVCDNAG